MEEVFDTLRHIGLVPVVRLDHPEQAGRLAEALLAGGLPCAEITFRAAGAVESIRSIAEKHPELLVGAGTVLRVEQAQQAFQAGARFIVSPGFSRPVVEWCRRSGVAVIPGAATATDILQAIEHGLSTVKVFPIEAIGGAALLEALAAPFGGMRFVPTGGVTAASLSTYLRIASVLAVGGSWMVAPTILAADRYDEVTRLAREAVEIVAQARGVAA
jgi:2-dehydro-3-deoxyphosphogluconate aldolase/(4S)-4-hydroxy-2-oxoglutarate aldolase